MEQINPSFNANVAAMFPYRAGTQRQLRWKFCIENQQFKQQFAFAGNSELQYENDIISWGAFYNINKAHKLLLGNNYMDNKINSRHWCQNLSAALNIPVFDLHTHRNVSLECSLNKNSQHWTESAY